jgi:hypothetical protein
LTRESLGVSVGALKVSGPRALGYCDGECETVGVVDGTIVGTLDALMLLIAFTVVAPLEGNNEGCMEGRGDENGGDSVGKVDGRIDDANGERLDRASTTRACKRQI